MSSLNYDNVAPEFDRRYKLYAHPGIERCLLDFIGNLPSRVLDVGCGTGKWSAFLVSAGHDVAGIEPSGEMLRLAHAQVKVDLHQGKAKVLPWPEESFDRVVYINVLHHVTDPLLALQEAFRVLRPGGGLLSVGLDPHWRAGQWYVYEYFPETLALDLARFPSRQQRTSWLLDVGFMDVSIRVAEHLQSERTLEEAIKDGVLERTFTSQMGLLSADAYAAGMRRIHDSAQNDDHFTLKSDVELYATEATKRARPPFRQRMDRLMEIKITEEPMTALEGYGRTPIAFEVDRVLDVVAQDGFVLSERRVEVPYMKDYDAIEGGPNTWAIRFDVSNWGLIMARVEGQPVGGAVIAFNTPDLNLLEGSRDLAVLWDIRVSPDYRGKRVGSALLRAVEAWSVSHGCRQLKVETQNVNVPACRFYEEHGFMLKAVDRCAYPDLPGEIQLVWYKDLSLSAPRLTSGRAG